MKKICKNCKHWNQAYSTEEYYHCGKCKELQFSDDILISVWGSNAIDYIETFETFGCILWTKKG